MWIETLEIEEAKKDHEVTPHVGVWIETLHGIGSDIRQMVTPHVGVWIETMVLCFLNICVKSHLM